MKLNILAAYSDTNIEIGGFTLGKNFSAEVKPGLVYDARPIPEEMKGQKLENGLIIPANAEAIVGTRANFGFVSETANVIRNQVLAARKEAGNSDDAISISPINREELEKFVAVRNPFKAAP